MRRGSGVIRERSPCEPRPARVYEVVRRLRVVRVGDVVRDADQLAARIEEELIPAHWRRQPPSDVKPRSVVIRLPA